MGLALATGALYWAAQPPLAFGALGFVALAPLVSAAQASSVARAGALGWLAGTVAFNGLTTPSVYEALVRAGHPAWVAAVEAFAVPQLTGALYMAAFAAWVAALERRAAGRWWRTLAIAAGWVAAEVGRTELSGLPWVLLAHSQTEALPWIQVADLAGAGGVGFVVALPGATLATLATDGRAGRRHGALAAVVAAAVLTLAYGYGHWRLARPVDAPAARRLRVALVQGAVPPEWRYGLAHLGDTVARYRELVARTAGSRPDVVVLPETAVSVSPAANARAFATLAGPLVGTDAVLLVGAPREVASAPGRATLRNAVYALDPGGAVRGVYDKRRLVPFGETSTWLLPGASAWFGDAAAYSAGDALVLLEAGGTRAAPLVCWEGIFASAVREAVAAGAGLLVSVSNDDWFGPRAATEQHLRATVLRAVESRRYLLRATNSGLTAVVDPRGAVVAGAPRATPAVVTADVVPLAETTPYARVGDAFAWACVLAAAAACLRRVA